MRDPQQRGQQEPMALVASKQPFRDAGLPKRIKSVQFSVMSPSEIEQAGVLHVFQRALYTMPERKPQVDGVLDPRLGVSSKSAVCETCGQKLADCVGHFGYIRLVKPVFHIGYFRSMLQILQCICKSCSSVLLAEVDKAAFLKRLRRPTTDHLTRARIFRTINDKCKRQRTCLVCRAHNATVKKATGNLKILHNVHRDDEGAYASTFQEAVKLTPALEPLVNKVEDDLNPERVLQLFRCMSDEDCLLLDLPGRPEHLLLQAVPVAPVCIRPSVEMDAMGSNEDDVTMKLMQITEVNNQLREGLKRGVPMSTVMETWDFLQVQCALLINADMPGISLPGATQGRPSRGFVQRLKGKQGRFRGNLSGKRVDFSGRTVISPDPNVAVDEVCVPQLMATTLTYPERVTQHNIHRLRKCIENGTSEWPGANFVCFPDGAKWFLKYGDRRRIARDLKVGDIVERHLDNGDIVLFNRQPSLHRMSIMAHKARVLPWRTLRFNECVCNPYNADFDGDEMNLHVPQTEEARAEAASLMGVIHNLRTPKNGEILVAATQDFLTASFLLTSKDMVLSRAEVSQLVCEMSDANVHIDLPTPAVLKPAEMWTGKQIFSMLMRPNAACSTCVTLETREKHFKRVPPGMDPSMGIEDAYVTIRNSELLTGRLGKGVLGSGNKAGLFQVLATDFGPEAAALCMGRLAKLAARSIGGFGFSIGIDDVTPTHEFNKRKRKLLLDGYDDCDQFRADAATGKLLPQPGSSIAQTLENKISSRLSKVRDEAGELCMQGIQPHNSALVMAQCGSKGSPINIAQMMALVGQQTVGGRRIPNGFQDRTLPHFPRGDVTAEAKGYVANSFFSGLVPTEFLFHTMAGREGLVDTAVKTAETGYMSRRLMKALEDLYVHYDNTVRNASNTIVQLLYGGDGMDPVAMEGSNGEPLQLSRLLAFVQTAIPRCQQGPGGDPLTRLPTSKELAAEVDRLLAEAGLVAPPPPPTRPAWSPAPSSDDVIEQAPRVSLAFCASLRKFLDEQVDAVRAAEACNALSTRGGVSLEELRVFVALCGRRYEAKRIDHGSTVGAVGAQSIGEPGTQMTLKTFHFAGVASMNVTLGVPRIKEIINASKNISTPIMEIMLDDTARYDEAEAKRVKARIERTTLHNVADLVVSCGGAECCVEIRLRRAAVAKLCLPPMDAYTLRDAVLSHPRSKIKHVCIKQGDYDVVRVYSPKILPIELQSTLHALQLQLANVVVAGIPSVERVVVASDTKDGKETYQLLAEGTNLQAVMGVQGVDGLQSDTNHVMEVEKCLGIEAARITIADQIKKTMGAHGMGIDDRHTMLLADCMTYKGEVLGITRNGIAKMKESVLMLASFEKTTDHLFDAALHGRSDEITGVSESIIMGIPMPVGTGLFKLRHATPEAPRDAPRPPPVLQAVFDEDNGACKP